MKIDLEVVVDIIVGVVGSDVVAVVVNYAFVTCCRSSGSRK